MQHCPSVCVHLGEEICLTLTWQCENTITQSLGRPWPVTLYLPWVKATVFSIYPSIQHLLWVDEVISFSFFFCFGCCFLHQMSLNDLFMGVYLFSDIQSIFQRARGPRWESHGTISVMHMQLKELGCVWFQQETTRVLHYGMDARWQHCSAMLEPDKVSFWILQRKKRPVVFSMFLNLSLVLLSF